MDSASVVRTDPKGGQNERTAGLPWAVFGFLLFLAAVIVVGAVVSAHAQARIAESAKAVVHTLEVVAAVERTRSDLANAVVEQRNLMLAPALARPEAFEKSAALLTAGVARLESLTADNSNQSVRVRRIEALIDERVRQLREALGSKDVSRALQAANDGLKSRASSTVDELRTELQALYDEELRLFGERNARMDDDRLRAGAVDWVTAAIGLVALILAWRNWSRVQRIRSLSVLELQRERARLHTTLHGVADGVATTDADGRIALLNPAAERLSGWTEAEALGRPASEVLRLRRADGGATTPDDATNDAFLLARDDRRIPVEVASVPTGDSSESNGSDEAGGRVGGAVLVVRDLSDRRRQEAAVVRQERQFQSLADSITQLAWIARADGHIFWYNRRWFEYTGATLEEMSGWGWRAVHDPDVLPQVVARWQKSLASGAPFDMTFPLRGADGTYRHFLTRVTPVRDDDGRISRWVGTNTDVSEGKRIEEELLDARGRLEMTLAAGEVGTWDYDVANDRVYADANLARWLPLEPVDVAGGPLKRYLELFVPDDRTGVLEDVRRALEDGATFETSFRIRGAHGEIRCLEVRGRIERRPDGKPIRLRGVSLDVTERHAAEAKLRESELRNRQIADAMPQIVWVSNVRGEHEQFNRRWREYTGGSGVGWEETLHPDDRDNARAKWRTAVAAGEPFENEHRLRAADGSYRWFLGRALPLRDATGAIFNWIGTCTDIDDFKRLEIDRQRFVSLVENSTDFVAMCNASGKLIYVNRAGRQMIGLHGEAARPPSLRDLYWPEDEVRVFDEYIPRALAESGGSWEVRFRRFSGHGDLWMEQHAFRLADTPDRRGEFATVCRNVTARRKMEDDLRTSAANLTLADRRKDAFLATLAHELRNPLAPLRNSLQLLKLQEYDETKLDEARAVMERQVAQLVRLVDDLLDVSRISRDRLELRTEPMDLAAAVASALETSRPLFDARDHRLIVEMPPEPIPLVADATRLAQTIANLLNNAAKYTEPGGRIVVAAERDGAHAVVTVADNGIGIAPEDLSSVFNMFAQAPATLGRAEGGLGIGLNLAKRLVEMHGGVLTAESAGVGRGSKFTIRLPLHAPTDAAAAPRREATSAAPQRRVLVVDDNVDAAVSLCQLLRVMGLEAAVEHDGAAAVALADAFRPDVILLDLGLPSLDGFEVCRAVRAMPWAQKVKIVAVSGWGQPEDRRRTAAAGFDRHFVKPLEPDALVHVLRGDSGDE